MGVEPEIRQAAMADERTGQCRAWVQFFEAMLHQGLETNVIIYSCWASACGKKVLHGGSCSSSRKCCTKVSFPT